MVLSVCRYDLIQSSQEPLEVGALITREFQGIRHLGKVHTEGSLL